MPSTPFVLPQYQGSYYDLQRQQALAQALTQGALTPQQTPAGAAVGPYQVQARTPWLSPVSQLAQGLLSAKLGQQAGQGMNNLGQQQWGALTSMLGGGAAGQSPQLNPDSADGGVGGAVADPFAGANGGNGAAAANAGGSGVVAGNAAGAVGSNGGVGSSPLNPLGMNPGMAAMMMMQSPDKYWESQAAAYKPAEIVQQIRAAGIDPNSPLGHQLAQNALAKANYIAPTSVRPGGALFDPSSGRMITTPAAAPDGFQNVQDPQSGQWYTVPVRGGTAAVKASRVAESIGKAYGDVTTGFSNGAPVFVNRGALADQTAGGGQPGGAPQAGGSSNPGRFSGYQAPGSAVAPSLAPGAGKLAEGSADSFNALRGAAASTPTAIDGYNKAEDALLAGVTTGPGSTVGTNIIGRLNTAGIPIMKGDVTGYQSLQKFLSNANAQAASASGYSGSDARFEAFSHGQPNTEAMNPQALRYAIQYVRGQQAGVQAKYQAAQAFLNQNGNSTVNYPQFEAQWNRSYSPDVMMVRSMPNPADQQSYLADLKKQGKLNDFIKSYQSMQQMGAF